MFEALAAFLQVEVAVGPVADDAALGRQVEHAAEATAAALGSVEVAGASSGVLGVPGRDRPRRPSSPRRCSRTVPIELEEAAWTDGASPMQGLRRIIMPLMAPGLSVIAIYTFIGLWGNFFVPFILLLSQEKQPMSVTIYTFFGQYGQIVYGQLAAYSLLYSLPSVLLYLALSKRLGGAFAFGGGVKG